MTWINNYIPSVYMCMICISWRTVSVVRVTCTLRMFQRISWSMDFANFLQPKTIKKQLVGQHSSCFWEFIRFLHITDNRACKNGLEEPLSVHRSDEPLLGWHFKNVADFKASASELLPAWAEGSARRSLALGDETQHHDHHYNGARSESSSRIISDPSEK